MDQTLKNAQEKRNPFLWKFFTNISDKKVGQTRKIIIGSSNRMKLIGWPCKIDQKSVRESYEQNHHCALIISFLSTLSIYQSHKIIVRK